MGGPKLLEAVGYNPEEWENATLSTFSEALSAYAADIQGHYDNFGLGIDANKPNGQTFC